MNKILWSGLVDDNQYRIKKVDTSQCIVEYKFKNKWLVASMTESNTVYMKAVINLYEYRA